MNVLFAMTLPALVIALTVFAALEVVLSRRRRREGERTKTVVGTAAVDMLGMALAPSTRHRKEHDEFQEIRRDEDGDAAPPRSTVDLETGVARLVLPRPPGAPGAPGAPGDDDLA